MTTDLVKSQKVPRRSVQTVHDSSIGGLQFSLLALVDERAPVASSHLYFVTREGL